MSGFSIETTDRPMLSINNVRRGWLRSIEADGTLLVSLDKSPRATFRCDVLLQAGGAAPEIAPGERVIVVPPDKSNDRGCVLGVIGKYSRPGEHAPSTAEHRADVNGGPPARVVRLVADEQISITCGESSITMLADGAILIRGVKIVTRAKGMNRIKGASVQIN